MESLSVPPAHNLYEQLRSLQEQRGTCSLRVHDGWRDGALRVEQGEVVSSSFGDLAGPPALEAMLAADDTLRFELLPETPPGSGSSDESMVVPISTWTGASEEPTSPGFVPPPLLAELQAGASASHTDQAHADETHVSNEVHEAIVLDNAVVPPPLALRIEAPAPDGARPPQRAPEEPQGPAETSRNLRVLIGSVVALALLIAIAIARTLEHEPHEPGQPSASPAPAAVSGETQTAVSAASAAEARPLAAGEAPAAPAGALAPTIPVRVLIGPDGHVKQTELVARRDGFAAVEQQALEVARGYRFALPASDTWLTVPVSFRPTPPTRHVTVKGSDTLGADLIPAWAEALKRDQPQVQIDVASLGTTPGIAALLDGSADVAAASRLIRTDELALAEKLGLQLREVFVGYDGVAIIVHADNPVQVLDLDTIARIFTGQVKNWSEIGGPSLPIRALGRPGYSGTHRLVKDRVLSRLGPDTGFGASVASFEQGKDVLAQVAKEPGAIGYVSLAQVSPGVRALSIGGNKPGEILPRSAADLRDATYPLSRALVLYLRPDSGAEAHAFVDFALSQAGQSVLEKQGFVPLPGGLSTRVTQEQNAQAGNGELIRIYFEPNSATIAHDSLADLTAAGLVTRAHSAVVIVGNADTSGNAEVNRRLAQHRAEMVAARLRALGSREATITVQVAAADHPIASNETSEGRKANRRVDVIIRSPAH